MAWLAKGLRCAGPEQLDEVPEGAVRSVGVVEGEEWGILARFMEDLRAEGSGSPVVCEV